MVPSSTQSATAIATDFCAGPKLRTASSIPRIPTLGTIMVMGLHTRLGAITANSGVCFPPDWLMHLQMLPYGPDLSPIRRSICATSFPPIMLHHLSTLNTPLYSMFF